MHRGVYGLSLARHLLGPVEQLQAMGRVGETGVDDDIALSLRHAGGAISTVRASLRTAGVNTMQIYGTDGTICVDPPLYRPFAARLIRVDPRVGGTSASGGGRLESLKEGGLAQGLNQRLARLKAFANPRGEKISAPFSGNGYGHEALAVAAAVRAGRVESPVVPLPRSVEIMGLIDRARQQIGMQTQSGAET